MQTKDKIVYKKECYLLNKIFFEIQNELGTQLQEKHYQKALVIKFKEYNIPYQKELKVDLTYNNEKIGIFYIDFLVWQKIVIEIKATPIITEEFLSQTLRYLQSLNLKLGLIINFRKKPLKPFRVLNSQYNDSQNSQT